MFAQSDFYLLVILISSFLQGKHSLEKYDMKIIEIHCLNLGTDESWKTVWVRSVISTQLLSSPHSYFPFCLFVVPLHNLIVNKSLWAYILHRGRNYTVDMTKMNVNYCFKIFQQVPAWLHRTQTHSWCILEYLCYHPHSTSGHCGPSA